MKKMLFVLGLLFVSANFCLAEDRTVFIGMPYYSFQSDLTDEFQINTILKSDREKYECVISYNKGKYFWKSRNNFELLFNRSGAYYIFFHVDSGNYVRIIVPEEIQKSYNMYDMRPTYKKVKCDYIEYINIGLGGVFYYGKTEMILSENDFYGLQ